jgi:hypothetical protein
MTAPGALSLEYAGDLALPGERQGPPEVRGLRAAAKGVAPIGRDDALKLHEDAAGIEAAEHHSLATLPNKASLR